MKKLLCVFALILGSAGAAQAQVYFGSGSDRPINPGAAQRDLDRQQTARPPVRARQKLVRAAATARATSPACAAVTAASPAAEQSVGAARLTRRQAVPHDCVRLWRPYADRSWRKRSNIARRKVCRTTV